MTVFLSFADNLILIRVLGKAENIVADIAEEITPGELFFGFSYDKLRALGEGEHELIFS